MDLEEAEFKQIYLTKKKSDVSQLKYAKTHVFDNIDELSSTVDWRTKGVVT